MSELISLVGEYVIDYKPKEFERVTLKDSQTAVDFARNIWPDSISVRESFVVLMLNRSNVITGYQVVSQGGLSGTVVDTRMIFLAAIKTLSLALILVHNHPSGNKKPSTADMSMTRKIIGSARLLDIEILDHIILVEKDYLSFADEGLLND